MVPLAPSPHTRDKVAILLLYQLITPHRCHVLPSWLAGQPRDTQDGVC